jgi:hypothetical protein
MRVPINGDPRAIESAFTVLRHKAIRPSVVTIGINSGLTSSEPLPRDQCSVALVPPHSACRLMKDPFSLDRLSAEMVTERLLKQAASKARAMGRGSIPLEFEVRPEIRETFLLTPSTFPELMDTKWICAQMNLNGYSKVWDY